jgi:hypothetical protein
MKPSPPSNPGATAVSAAIPVPSAATTVSAVTPVASGATAVSAVIPMASIQSKIQIPKSKFPPKTCPL